MKPTTQIIAGGIIAILILLGILLVIWIKRDTDKASAILVKSVIAPLFLAVALLLTEILSPLDDVKMRVPVVILRDYQARLIPIYQPVVLEGYFYEQGIPSLFLTYQSWLSGNQPPLNPETNIKDKNQWVIEQGEFFLDLLEASFWEWLSTRYRLHWDVQRQWFQRISAGGGSSSAAPDAEQKPKILNSEELGNLLSENALMKSAQPYRLGSVSIPSDSQVSSVRRKGYRAITVRNSRLEFAI